MFPAKRTHLSEGKIGIKTLHTKSSTSLLRKWHIGKIFHSQMTKCYANKNQQVSAIGISTDIRQWSNLVPRVFSFSNMAGHSGLVVPVFWVSPYPIFIRLCFGYPQWPRKIVPFRPECWTAVHSLYFEPKRKMSNLFKTFWRYPYATFCKRYFTAKYI